MDSHADFNFILGKVGFRYGGTGDLEIEDEESSSVGDSWVRYVAVIKADSDGAEVLSHCFCDTINFVEGCASPCQGASNFVDEDCTSKAAGS